MRSTTIIETVYKTKKRLYKPRKPRTLIRRTSKKKKATKRRIKRSTPVSKLDAVFSTWVRVSHAKNGIVSCYTCPAKNEIKKMQNGHYVSRSARSLRWEPDNCRPQCYGCNVMHGGEPITFRENLIKELGEKAVLELESKRHVLFKPTEEWLQEQVIHYSKLTEYLT